MIAVTQAPGAGPGKDYVDRQPAAGKTRTKALRLLRRRLSDRVFTTLISNKLRRIPARRRRRAARLPSTTSRTLMAVAACHRSIAELDRPQPRSLGLSTTTSRCSASSRSAAPLHKHGRQITASTYWPAPLAHAFDPLAP